ncbi:hypothetical protein MPER_05567 [Moniliophthora perniciosa FA553]|nr:hypothetical protein MPER_05567 [Moniliophthora perniciosa FA553]
MLQISSNALGQKGTLTLWAFVVIVQYMMGSSMLLAASRQTYAFSRDHALPFSSWLYRMNSYTETPVNTVIFDAGIALLLGLLIFAGDSAINADSTLLTRYQSWLDSLGKNDFKPGPFSLGVFSLPVAVIAVLFMTFLGIVFLFPTTPQTDVADMNYTVVVLGGVMLLSVVWYYFPKYGGVHWFTGPIANIKDSAPELAGQLQEEPVEGNMSLDSKESKT